MDENRGDTSEPGEKKGKGRPKAQIDIAGVERLAGLGLSGELIADIIGISYKTLQRHLKTDPDLVEAIRAGKQKVKTNIRAALLKHGLDGNTRILLRLAESEGVLKPVGIALQGQNGGPIDHRHTGNGSAEFFAEAGELMRKIQDAARNRDGSPDADAMAGDGPPEADSAE